MIPTIRTRGKVCVFALALIAFSNVAPVFATEQFAWISSDGVDTNPCSPTQPCATFTRALAVLEFGGQINCINSPGIFEGDIFTAASMTIDCAGVHAAFGGGGFFPNLAFNGFNQAVKIRNLTINGIGGTAYAIGVSGSGTLILENCVVEGMPEIALDIEPSGPLNLVIKNTRISNGANGAAIFLRPAAGGSINATFDHVTITGNRGGGIKADSTNGNVNLDVTDSEISNNANNGIIAVGGAGQSMISVKNSVIARNGQSGVAASGATAAVLVQTTLLDQNVAGATSVASGGHISTYQNNSIVGTIGSGFTGTVSPQ